MGISDKDKRKVLPFPFLIHHIASVFVITPQKVLFHIFFNYSQMDLHSNCFLPNSRLTHQHAYSSFSISFFSLPLPSRPILSSSSHSHPHFFPSSPLLTPHPPDQSPPVGGHTHVRGRPTPQEHGEERHRCEWESMSQWRRYEVDPKLCR